MQKNEKTRVYALARELDMDYKDLLVYCKELGFDVKNQLSSLDPEQCDQLKERVASGSKGGPAPTPNVAPRPTITHQSIADLNKVRVLPTRAKKGDSELGITPMPPTQPVAAPAAPGAPAPTPVAPVATPVVPAPIRPAEPVAPMAEPVTPTIVAQEAASAPPRPLLPDLSRSRDLRDLNRGRSPDAKGPQAPKPDGGAPASPPMVRRAFRPGVRPHPSTGASAAKPIPTPSLREKLFKTAEPVKPKEAVLKPKVKFESDEQMRRIGEAQNKKQVEQVIKGPITPGAPVIDIDEDDELKKKHGAADAGGIPGRSERHARRKERAEKRKATMAVTITGDGQVELLEEDERVRRRKAAAHKKQRQITQPRAGKVPIEEPITVRALSEAIGWKVGKLLFQLVELGASKNITVNSIIETELAETVALEANVELDIRRAPDAEERLMASHAQQDNPEELLYRAPVVTIMGHVDHGKTTLLDFIRQSNVVDTEAGGITQVIRAWRVEHNGKPITFIDTPGHEAFTKMRARGAQVTDIAVIVVAATDGVMPQTEEAINHVKAAGVQMVICITKTDMPNANVMKTRQQLYSLNVLPDGMGGDVPFVETALVKEKDGNNWKVARGVDELLENLAIQAEVRELKANPNKPANGTCLEAHKEGDEGVFATLLVQQGTLRRGDVLLCGGSYGRVRAMYNDLGQPIDEAGPSVPVRITGLDEVPDAGDSFHIVPDLSVAREIAETRREKKQEEAHGKHTPLTLESLGQLKVAEVKIILKADFRGSIEAIKAELEKLKHEEVRVRLLHAAIGGITESDVQLALTSPEDTLIVGFNAVPDNAAKELAEARGVPIREYNIIYNLTDDIKKALEGKLKPREEIVHLGRAVVRKTFKISKVGTVAGCFVTQGTIERSAKVRLIRDGVVIYPPADKTVGLDSLKRVKDDVREVAQGYDCGIKIAGYDDVKEGDVIEAFRIDQVKRTL